MYFKLHLWLHINKTFIKIYFKQTFASQGKTILLFAKFCSFCTKTRRKSLVYEIGYKGIKLITFTTEVNLFKGIKF